MSTPCQPLACLQCGQEIGHGHIGGVAFCSLGHAFDFIAYLPTDSERMQGSALLEEFVACLLLRRKGAPTFKPASDMDVSEQPQSPR